jgi:hypothetical protein
MDFSGIFSNLDVVLKLMFVELLLGCIAGFIFKQIIKIKARNDENTQIFSPSEYTSVHFGKNFPRCSMDILLLDPEFILVKIEGSETTEEFYNFLGACEKFKYQNGRIISGGLLLLNPVYLCTVVIPSVIGFFPSLIPFINQYFSPLFYSGLLWMFATFLIQTVIGILKNVSSNQS